ncbi:MAG: helix-turn-helix domain-containing protein [Segniliparus sp.]|uniref:helix-turn-helix domain-containing protein n=1 Tax=Segniliparus sp. TaxID=2804064 RepID=UPI003F355B83
MSRRVLRGFDRHEFKRIRLAWHGTGITPQDLGRLARVGVSTIWKWEQGQRSPNIDKLAPVLDVLEVQPDAVIRIPADELFLSDLRNLSRLTQPQLAKAAGMSTTVLSMLEHGTTPMTDAKAQALAPILGVPVEVIYAAWERARDRPPGTPA